MRGRQSNCSSSRRHDTTCQVSGVKARGRTAMVHQMSGRMGPVLLPVVLFLVLSVS